MDGVVNINLQSDAPQLVMALRRELAKMLRDAAAKESDPRVTARLSEIAAAFSQDLSHAEGAERVRTAPLGGEPRRHIAAPAKPPTPSLDAVATESGKATTETLKP